MCADTGGSDVAEKLCDPCVDKMSNPAFLQCLDCKSTWGIVDPGPLKAGITVEAGHTYYTKGCCFCKGEELGTVDITGICETKDSAETIKRTQWMKPASSHDISLVKKFSALKFKAMVDSEDASEEQMSVLAELIARVSNDSYIGKTNKFYTWFTPQRKKLSASKFSFVRL